MQILAAIERNRILSFVLGTVLLQSTVFCSGLYFLSRQKSSSAYETRQFSHPEAAAPAAPAAVAPESFTPAKSAVAEPAPAPAEQSAPAQSVKYKVKPGDTLAKIWAAHGGTYQDALKAAKAYEKAGVGTGLVRSG
jgi:hypothetical protein